MYQFRFQVFLYNTASILSLVIGIGVSKALNLNIKALFKANNSLLKASDYRVSSLKAFF